MIVEKRETSIPSQGLVIVTPEPGDAVLVIGPGSEFENRSVRVNGPIPVEISADAGILSLHAPESDVTASGDVFLQNLEAASWRGDGDLYVLFRMKVISDLTLSGELKGERHFPYEIGGDLTSDGVSVDGHVTVGGRATTPWHDVRSITAAGGVSCDETRNEP